MASSSFTVPSLGSITHLLNVKLERSNYLVWRSQFLPILRVHDLEGFIDGSLSCPPEMFSPSSQGKEGDVLKANPEYTTWMKRDQLLLSWIISSLSENVLAHAVSLSTSHVVWTTLAKTFAPSSSIRVQ
ncbi:hypothetical protein GIB67_018113 [Kingdonia uniflora]|uniref:Retrotransposon Copia-like N-terminal domain-containing protein n=1 Tax=Kingdonia uniflora TaxID=39325 RepID=A0A7J7NWP9_9MAGN|nr:hypothetical protein GIB67_018113 [Kingdonia uniflora]